jgi:nitroimidazol reductase NimA-like FMN-containing flavoprotein (pyridoxamine 5'-phosphate oxidase superfamily)
MVDEGEPYLVAMNFAYINGFLYMHSAKRGRKIDILMINSKVAFQTDTGVELIIAEEACESTTRYMSVVGTGKAFLIDEKEEKTKVLDAIMTKPTGRTGFEYSEKSFERTLIIKVVIDSMTGKKSGY